MFGISIYEFFVIAFVVIVLVTPKDVVRCAYKLGCFVRHIRQKLTKWYVDIDKSLDLGSPEDYIVVKKSIPEEDNVKPR